MKEEKIQGEIMNSTEEKTTSLEYIQIFGHICWDLLIKGWGYFVDKSTNFFNNESEDIHETFHSFGDILGVIVGTLIYGVLWIVGIGGVIWLVF